MKKAYADVVCIVQQGIFHFLELVCIALNHAFLTLPGSRNSVNRPYSAPKNDRASTPGSTSPYAWLLPLRRLQNTTSAGLKSSGSIL
jgi:hypothetical protein